VDPGACASKLFLRGMVELGQTDDSLEQGGPVRSTLLFSGSRAQRPHPIPQQNPDSIWLPRGSNPIFQGRRTPRQASSEDQASCKHKTPNKDAVKSNDTTPRRWNIDDAMAEPNTSSKGAFAPRPSQDRSYLPSHFPQRGVGFSSLASRPNQAQGEQRREGIPEERQQSSLLLRYHIAGCTFNGDGWSRLSDRPWKSGKSVRPGIGRAVLGWYCWAPSVA